MANKLKTTNRQQKRVDKIIQINETRWTSIANQVTAPTATLWKRQREKRPVLRRHHKCTHRVFARRHPGHKCLKSGTFQNLSQFWKSWWLSVASVAAPNPPTHVTCKRIGLTTSPRTLCHGHVCHVVLPTSSLFGNFTRCTKRWNNRLV